MANWETKRIVDVINEIEDGKFVLPVIQRSLVWTEEKMELLFDTLLKGDSFGGIMVIEEEKNQKPLFSFRPFTKDGNFIPSMQIDKLTQNQFFVIDGQQRLQSFYIGLSGSINGNVLYFDLFSDYNVEYEFKFENDINKLPKEIKENFDRPLKMRFWYSAKDLLRRLKTSTDEDQTAEEIISDNNITDEKQRQFVTKNVKSFYKNINNALTLGISKVSINKTLPEIENKQRIVELFRRLNDGGTVLSSFDLVASVLKGYSWEMESFLREMLQEYYSIGLSQENLIKLIFLLQDNYNKEMAAIEASDAEFAIVNKDKIKATIKALKDFLKHSKLIEYYDNKNRSFIPLFFVAYHIFHRGLDIYAINNYFNNAETGNEDFSLMKKWLFNFLTNGVFKSKGAGWVPYKTGIRKILDVMKNFKGMEFPLNKLFDVYREHQLTFRTDYNKENLNQLDHMFVFYLIYDLTYIQRTNDVDHVMPRSLLEGVYSLDQINNIRNYQLLDYGTNRGEKNGKPFSKWVNNSEFVKDKILYIKTHLIPSDESTWLESNFEKFCEKRSELILEKVIKYNMI
jgi:hypothetical protein